MDVSSLSPPPSTMRKFDTLIAALLSLKPMAKQSSQICPAVHGELSMQSSKVYACPYNYTWIPGHGNRGAVYEQQLQIVVHLYPIGSCKSEHTRAKPG